MTFLALVGLSVLALVVVTVVVTPTWLRLVLSLGAVLPGYAAALLLWVAPRWRRKITPQPRRFYMLRGTIDRFLEEVRRLNSVRVDIETGQQSPMEARPQLAEIEARMARLIQEMRDAAGQVTPASGIRLPELPER